jgi:hypothetical protein
MENEKGGYEPTRETKNNTIIWASTSNVSKKKFTCINNSFPSLNRIYEQYPFPNECIN